MAHNTRFCYSASYYRSHARVARDNANILARFVTLVSEPAAADIIVLHHEPHYYPAFYKLHDWLHQRYVIGYAVWEASDLPQEYIQGLQLVQEVWTCSEYCRKVFARYHNVVRLVPHAIARDWHNGSTDLSLLAKDIEYNPSLHYYLCFAKTSDKRKNLDGVLKAFQMTCRDMPDARLIIRAPLQNHLIVQTDTRILHVSRHLSEAEVAWLYKIAELFISAHRSEGWGLCISDAMLTGTPIVASNYSGPLDYLSAENSWLLPCYEASITPEDEYHFFNRSMKWGYPDIEILAGIMLESYSGALKADSEEKQRQALIDAKNFSLHSLERTIRHVVSLIDW